MQVAVLGAFRLTSDRVVVDVGGARLRTLLIRLALEAGRPVPADVLVGALWPYDERGDATHALQALVSRLRRALPDRTLVESVPRGYRLAIAPDDVDAVRFERLAQDGQRALRAGEYAAAAGQLREALELWRGPAFQDVPDAPYARAAAVRLDELRMTATEDRVEADLALGAPHLVPDLEELTTAHPNRERSHLLLMRALQAEGRRAEALGAFQRLRERLVDELGTEPGPALQELHVAMLREPTRAGTVPETGGRRRRGNLRTPLTSFVGRDAERRQIREQLERSRLVTLVGPGGVGKTRLATTAASELEGRYAGGVFLVELAPLVDARDLPGAILAALGLRESGTADALRIPYDRACGPHRTAAAQEPHTDLTDRPRRNKRPH